jgi:hypothetical protein
MPLMCPIAADTSMQALSQPCAADARLPLQLPRDLKRVSNSSLCGPQREARNSGRATPLRSETDAHSKGQPGAVGILGMLNAIPATIVQTFHIVRENWRDPAYGFWGAGVGGGEPLPPPDAHRDAGSFVFTPEPTVLGAAIQLWLHVEAAPRALAAHYLQQALPAHFATQALCPTHRQRQEREVHRREAPQRQENRDVKFLRRRATQADMRQAMLRQRAASARQDANVRQTMNDAGAGLLKDAYCMATRQPAAACMDGRSTGGSWLLPGVASSPEPGDLWLDDAIEEGEEHNQTTPDQGFGRLMMIRTSMQDRPALFTTFDMHEDGNRTFPVSEHATADFPGAPAISGPSFQARVGLEMENATSAHPEDMFELTEIELAALAEVNEAAKKMTALHRQAYPFNLDIKERIEEILDDALADAHGVHPGPPLTSASRVRVVATKFTSETYTSSLKKSLMLSLFDIASGKLQRDYGINYWFDVAVAEMYKPMFRLRYRHFSGSFPITDRIENQIAAELSRCESDALSKKARETILAGQIRLRALQVLNAVERADPTWEIAAPISAAVTEFLENRAPAYELTFHYIGATDIFAIPIREKISGIKWTALLSTSRKNVYLFPKPRMAPSDSFIRWLRPALPLATIIEHGRSYDDFKVERPFPLPRYLGGLGIGRPLPAGPYRFRPLAGSTQNGGHLLALAHHLDNAQIAKAKADLTTLLHTSSDVWKRFAVDFAKDFADYFSLVLSIVSLGSPAVASQRGMVLAALIGEGAELALGFLIAEQQDDPDIKNEHYMELFIGSLLSSFGVVNDAYQLKFGFAKGKILLSEASNGLIKQRQLLDARIKSGLGAPIVDVRQLQIPDVPAMRPFMRGPSLTALADIDRHLRRHSSYAAWIATPQDLCEAAAGEVIKILQDLGYATEVRGMWRFKSAGDFMPGNHFVVIGSKDGRTVLVDATAGQFSWVKSEESVIIGPEDHWASTFVNLEANQRTLIRYKDFPGIDSAQAEFSQSRDVDIFSGDYITLNKPRWVHGVLPAQVAELKQRYIDLERQHKVQRYAMAVLERLKTSLPNENTPVIRGLAGIDRSEILLLFSREYEPHVSALGIRKIRDIAAALDLSTYVKVTRRYQKLFKLFAAAEANYMPTLDEIAGALTAIAKELVFLIRTAPDEVQGKELIKVLIEVEVRQTKIRNAIEAYARDLANKVLPPANQ